MKKNSLRFILIASVIFLSAASFIFINVAPMDSSGQEDFTPAVEISAPQAPKVNHSDIEFVKGFFGLVHKFVPAS